jgi:energy-coupling factor transporter ATP-binding protein EcfA2
VAYDFRALSPTDFEDLVGGLLREELNLRLESFGRGRDQGIDLRFAATKKGKGVVQAKHFVDSGFLGLLQSLKKERPKIDLLAPDRYILATSVPMTPSRKDKIIEALHPHITDPTDVLGQEDINALLVKHSHVERRFYKLWITSTNVLEKVLHNATFVSSMDEADRIERVVKIYVDTGALEAALNLLEKKRLLIISGAPGVGKSTLARILAWHFMSADWELISVESFDDALSVFDSHKKQVFFFDDFMGQIRLSASKINQTDEKLLRFIERVQRADHSLFVLTSREYILNQARFESEKIGSAKVDLRTFTISIESYHRAARAKILYNHVYYSDAGKEYKAKIIDDLFYMKMINHDNFSPRLIESLTTPEVIENVPVSEYRKWIIDNLDHPTMLWKTPFEAHLSRAGRNLVITMFFESDGVSIERLRYMFGRVHARISQRHNVPTDAIDFARAIKETEGTFINISNSRASFPNPSLRDFLDYALSGSMEVLDVLSVMTTSKGIERVVDHLLARREAFTSLREDLIEAARSAALELERTPISREVRFDDFIASTYEGLPISSRISLLLNLWEFVRDNRLAEIAGRVACQIGQDPDHRTTFLQKMAPLNILKDIQFCDFPARQLIEDAIRENAFVAPYAGGGRPSMRDMAEMKGYLERSEETDLETHLSRLSQAAQKAAVDFADEVSECTTTDEVQSLRLYLDELSELIEEDIGWLEDMLDEREAELEEEERGDDIEWDGPRPGTALGPSSDEAIISLFSTLH